MTLAFARAEAARRDKELGTKHYVARRPYSYEHNGVESYLTGDGYMVLTSVPANMVEIPEWDTDGREAVD